MQRIAASLASLDPARMNDHLVALAATGSRDPRHPGHAKAVAYIKEQLKALEYRGWSIESQRTVYQGIPLENIFATIDPAPGATAPNGSAQRPPPPVGASGWVMLAAHYDTTAVRSPTWRPAVDPAPGADDNGTGTAALLEMQAGLSDLRAEGWLTERVVLAFFDGEELFFKGSAAYVATLPRPAPYAAVVNIDMVGFNPLADRLDLIWYTDASAALRDRVVATNDRYGVGVAPLVAQFAGDGNTILDAAPFGLAGIPSVALVERYGPADATYPGNSRFHTPSDTPDGVTNPRLWLKAARLTLGTALEMVVRDPRP
ncbi:MAG: M28 family peptidase [Candidatus Limnocylindria bacterium]